VKMSEKPAKKDKKGKGDKAEKPEKPEKVDKADKPEKVDKAEKPEKADKADKPKEKAEKAEKPKEKAEKPKKDEQPAQDQAGKGKKGKQKPTAGEEQEPEADKQQSKKKSKKDEPVADEQPAEDKSQKKKSKKEEPAEDKSQKKKSQKDDSMESAKPKESKGKGKKKGAEAADSETKESDSASTSAAAKAASKSEYKLFYFNGRGKAELMRLCMAYGNIQFDDIRFEDGDWAKFKTQMPFGQVPVLEVRGFKLAQSAAILQYLGRVVGLVPKDADSMTEAHIHMICEGARDVQEKFGPILYRFEDKPEQKKAEMDKFEANDCPQWTAHFERMLGKNQYFIGDKMTLADLTVYHIFSEIQGHLKNCLKDSPNLAALVKRVGDHPSISKYVQTRPKSPW